TVIRYWLEAIAPSGSEGRRGWRPLAELLRVLLAVVSWPYGLVVKLRNFLYDRQFWMFKTVHFPVAVVSVGNVAVGGTGKTPFVELLARRLSERGRGVCILSRGYGHGSEARRNDEYLMLKELLPEVPHLVGPERLLTGIQAILQFRSDVLILDDGFQHRKLARDLDIVLVDALQPLGLGHLLPRGRLRELVSGLGRAHLICLTHSDLVEPEALEQVSQRVSRLTPGVPILEAKHQPRALRPVLPDGEEQPVGALAGKRVAAFCALGSPESFIEELRRLGAEVVHQALFPDHHRFTVSEFQRLCADAGDAGAELLLCTHKDAVKLPDDLSPPLPVLALEMELVILRGEEHLQEALSALPVKVGPMRLRYQGEEDSAEP
ncbi:MAG: tetraacyldisaccharide 4'-kinase, partial [Planctomycetes bacterium]|nr:tetraacyldisaccharide 4'-kinase [Planctomycetota bacterium]